MLRVLAVQAVHRQPGGRVGVCLHRRARVVVTAYTVLWPEQRCQRKLRVDGIDAGASVRVMPDVDVIRPSRLPLSQGAASARWSRPFKTMGIPPIVVQCCEILVRACLCREKCQVMRVAKYFFKHKQTNYYLLNPLYSRYNKKKRGLLKFCFGLFAGISGNLYRPERTDQKGRLNTMFNLNNDTKKAGHRFDERHLCRWH